MAQPIYVPVLPVRESACTAYRNLEPRVRRLVTPLWTIPPYEKPGHNRGAYGAAPAHAPTAGDAALRAYLAKRVDGLITAMHGMTGWVDATHVECRHGDAFAEPLWRLVTRSGLRLVTGPERDPTCQRRTADLAFQSERGLGIRLRLDDQPDERDSAGLLRLIHRLGLPPSDLDLLLDLRAVTGRNAGLKIALTALDLLAPLVPWRTVVLASGAFPRLQGTAGEPRNRHADAVPRHDWHLREAVLAARPALPGTGATVLYGDYSVDHPAGASLPPLRDRRDLPHWGALRYTTPDHFLIAPAPLRAAASSPAAKAGRVAHVRAQARRIVEAEGFRGAGGPGSSEGERWLHSCAYGNGSRGSGNAAAWLQAGHTQHMTLVARQLAGQ